MVRNRWLGVQEYKRNIGYRALINVTVLSGIGDGLYNIVFVIYAGSLSFKTLAVSMASMATLIPSLLSVIVGHIADRTQHKVRFMMIARIAQFILFISLACLITFPGNMGLFLVLLAINIISDTLSLYSNGLALPLLKHLLPEKALKKSMGFMTAMTLTVQVVFQGVGSVVIVVLKHNYAAVGFLNALTFMAAAVLIKSKISTLSSAEPNAIVQTKEALFGSIRSTLGFIRRRQFLFSVIILTFLINVFGASISGLINVTLLYYKSMWFINYGNSVAIMNMMISIGMIVGSLFTGKITEHMSLMHLFMMSLLLSGMSGVSFIWPRSFYLSAMLLFGMGYFIGKINPRISAIVLHSVSEQRLAAVDGLLNMVSMLGAPVGQVLFLGIANGVSIISSWLLFSVGCLVLVIIIYSKFSKMKEPVF